jgi:hypothetical protein
MRTPRLPVVDWTDAPADLNGLVRFAGRRNLVSARVPLHFNWPLRQQKHSRSSGIDALKSVQGQSPFNAYRSNFVSFQSRWPRIRPVLPRLGLTLFSLADDRYFRRPDSVNSNGQKSAPLCHLLFFFGIFRNVTPMFNRLKTKRHPLYIRNQSVPRCKHFPPRL